MSSTATVARENIAQRESLIRAANAILALAACVLVLLSVYFFHAHKARYVIAGPAVLALCCLVLLVLKPAIRVFAASVVVGGVVGLYATELLSHGVYNDDLPFQTGVREAAAAAGIRYDPRTRLETILEERSQGVKAYPPFYPYLLVGNPLHVDGEPTIPLGNHSDAFVVACNEGGQYLTYTTDQYGFPNPTSSWKTPLEIAIVGDSNAVGECVPEADSIAGQLRTKFPATITLGAGGHGPIFTLASIREYLQTAKPKEVLWIYSESHTPQYLEIESHSPFMLRYVDDPDFSQKLIDKQPALDQAIKGYVENGIHQELHAHSWPTSVKNFLVLKNVRTLEFEYRARLHPAKPPEFNAPLFERTLQEGSREVQAWGGQVILLYWPDAGRYPGIANYTPALRHRHDEDRSKVLEIASRLGVKVIDLTPIFPDLPAERAKENARYFYSFPAHYTPEGYRTASQAIISSLENQR